MKIKIEQTDLFPEYKLQKKKYGVCIICKRKIKKGTIGNGCYRKILREISEHKKAILKCREMLKND